MSKTEALEMISFRSRSSSSEVQAFVLLGFLVFSPESCSFFGISTRGSHGNRINRECCGARKGPEEQATID